MSPPLLNCICTCVAGSAAVSLWRTLRVQLRLSHEAFLIMCTACTEQSDYYHHPSLQGADKGHAAQLRLFWTLPQSAPLQASARERQTSS